MSSGERDSVTVPTAPPSSGSPSRNGGTYDFTSFIRPRMYGSTDMNMLRTRTCPGASSGWSDSVSAKLAAVGHPEGRETRTIWRGI